MPELRWILLGLGVLFWIALWWRETRRPHQAAGSTARAGEPERAEPQLTALDKTRRTPAEMPARESVIFDDGIELEAELEPPANGPAVDPAKVRAAQERVARELFSKPVATGPLERIEPVMGDTAGGATEVSASELPKPLEEKIVTLRLGAPPLERFDGGKLLESLRAVGLEFGKFSIFHKTTAAGATLYSVASLVEPGTFDLERIASQRFPGVSLFAVLPGPREASAILEDMIATGRALAERLHGVLQDERGSTMTAQRLADLRATVAAWEGRAAPRASQD
jgi:cell division protein ZipA